MGGATRSAKRHGPLLWGPHNHTMTSRILIFRNTVRDKRRIFFHHNLWHKMSSLIRIKLDGAGLFGEIRVKDGDTVSGVADQACAKFTHWGANSGMLSLYHVAEGGEEEPSDDAIRAVLSSGGRLGVGKSLKSAKVSPGAWLVARITSPMAPDSVTPSKRFFLVVSGENKWGEIVPVKMDVTLSTDKELKDLIYANGGGNLVLFDSSPPHPNLKVMDIVGGGTYTLFGGRQKAYLAKENWTQQADKVLEEVSTLAVRAACEESMGELLVLLDTKIKNSEGFERQFDGLLINTTSAIVVEAKHVAKEEDIETVLSGADFLKRHALEDKSHKHFKGITDFLPVLAANRISESMIALCEKRGIGVVKPSGSGHTYTPPPHLRTPQSNNPRSLPGRRSFHTLTRVLRAIV